MMHETSNIEAWTPEIIIKQLREYRGGKAGEISPAAMRVLTSLLELEPEDRAAVLASAPAFMCEECGEASCIHGYSDE